MLLKEVAELLGCEVIGGGEAANPLEVESCFAADLMSEVLAFCGTGALLLTGLTSIQSVHTADVADLRAILYVNAKVPPRPVIDLAQTADSPGSKKHRFRQRRLAGSAVGKKNNVMNTV